MAQWTSEYAILRDLSVAQGRVPVAIERTLGAGDKPPSLNITEETEEEFFKHCSADANLSAAPDLGLIQKMLDMVRDVNDRSDDEDLDKAVVIEKLNTQCPEFILSHKNTSTPTNPSPIKPIIEKPKKRQRNIAVESILRAIADNKQINDVILRTPTDFMNVETIEPKTQDIKELQVAKDISGGDNTSLTPTAAEKVKGWLETQTGSPFPKKTTKVTLEATNIVFKKKGIMKKCPKENMKKIIRSPISSSSNSGEYKPSTLANEYYLKYVERSKFKESVKEDIWTKAERKMKEIEYKRQQEAAQALTSPSCASPTSGLNQSFEETQSTDAFTERIVAETKISRCLELVALPQHRHRLTAACVVCDVMRNKPDITQIEVYEGNDYNNTENVDSTNIELDNGHSKELENGQLINIRENVDSIINKLAKLNKESTEELIDNLQIAELIDNKLPKFVESSDLNRNCPEFVENSDISHTDFVDSEQTNSDIALDVENVYECVPKTELSFLEAGLSDRSF